MADSIALTRLARWATAALWPVAVAVPLTPLVLGAVLGSPRPAAAGFVAQLTAVEAVLLLATLAGARLVTIRMRRTGVLLVSRYESWAVLALALGGVVVCAGVALISTESVGPAGPWLVDGLWGVAVATGALVVLPLRALKTIERDR